MPLFGRRSVKSWQPEASTINGVPVPLDEYAAAWTGCIDLALRLADDGEEPDDLSEMLSTKHELVSQLIERRKQLESLRPKDANLRYIHIESVALIQCVCGVYNHFFGMMLMDSQGRYAEAQALSRRSAEFEPMRDRAYELLRQSFDNLSKRDRGLYASFLAETGNPLSL